MFHAVVQSEAWPPGDPAAAGWETRFKNELVEEGHAARNVAAYIDLNPVRAGMVKDPKDYRWCHFS